MTRTILCLTLILAACGDNITPPSAETCGVGLVPYVGTPSHTTIVQLWLQEDADLDPATALEACAVWQPVGVQCAIASGEKAAQVRIYAKHDACVETPSGGYVLATSGSDGVIDVDLECLRELFASEEPGEVNRQVLKLVLTHELGHQAGMWWHVPAKCEDSAAKDDFEKDLVRRGICGPSLMNAMIDVNVCFMSEIDAEAFALRTPSDSPFPRVTASENQDGCVFTYTP